MTTTHAGKPCWNGGAIDAAALLALVESLDQDSELGEPEYVLRTLVDEVAESLGTGHLAEVCRYIIKKAHSWSGSICVTVQQHEGGTYEVLWSTCPDDGTTCGLHALLVAIETGNKRPDWYDDD
jgi:hypothetical protein